MTETTVVLADDHPVYRAGLAQAIRERADLRLLADCADGHDALAHIRTLRPDVALLDVRMGGLDGLGILEALGGARAQTRVVFLSAFEDGELVYRAMTGGATGYLSKAADRDDICDALVEAATGRTVLSPELHAGLVGELRRHSGEEQRPRLSAREQEIMRLTARGMTAPQIAVRLGIGPTTVKTHLRRVYRKLGVADRAAMVAEAMREGLLT